MILQVFQNALTILINLPHHHLLSVSESEIFNLILQQITASGHLKLSLIVLQSLFQPTHTATEIKTRKCVTFKDNVFVGLKIKLICLL